MSLPKNHIPLSAFLKSQFLNCRLRWMFYSRTVNSKINRIHEKCLRINILSYSGHIYISMHNRKVFGTKMVQSFKCPISNDIFKVISSQGDVKFQFASAL